MVLAFVNSMAKSGGAIAAVCKYIRNLLYFCKHRILNVPN